MKAPVKREPWHPPEYDVADVAAMQAVASGQASPDQQQRALKWIITQACMTYDEPFLPGQPDVSQNLAGRRSAGLQIVKLVNLPMEVVKRGSV